MFRSSESNESSGGSVSSQTDPLRQFTELAGGSAQVQVYSVDIVATGSDENFYAFLDRVVPLTWMKVVSSSYTPYAGVVDSAGAPVPQTFTISLKIYVNAEATVKRP